MKHFVGERFNRWTLTRFVGRHNWEAVCDCGTKKIVSLSNLLRGASVSCGCSRREGLVYRFPDEWGIWKNMRRRCHSPKSESYRLYGARGIRVCNRWRYSFANFIDDMGPRPDKSMSIERSDNNKGYCPSNCRWATWLEQASNRRTNIMVTAFGETKTMIEWSRDRRCRVFKTTLRYRLRNGMAPERAITKQPFGSRK